jgi:hypothetical protein
MAKAVRTSLLLATAVVAILQASPLPARDSVLPPSSVPVTEWLAGPDRQDFPWSVQILGPSLTLQQHNLVQIVAALRGRDLLRGVSIRDLHFVTKIADDQGNWLEGQSYSHFVTPADFSPGDTLRSFSNLYLRPGSYTVAMIAYDSLHHSGNVWRSKLSVDPVNDLLPALGRAFPAVEFLPEVSLSPLLKDVTWSLTSQLALASLMVDPLALGHGTADLPIANKRPVRIDVIVNLSDGMEVLTRQQEASWWYKYDEGWMLQVGNLLSQLAPQEGCVRFSAIDILRHDVVVDRVDSQNVDWDNISKKIAATELDKIDIKTLTQKETALWFKQFVERVTEDAYSCALRDAVPEHVVVVVSRAMPFPIHATVEAVESNTPEPLSYYLVALYANGSLNWDEIEKVLKPMKPKRLPFTGALGLRRTVEFIMTDLASSSK